jgi:hypothetical protein
MGSMSVHRAIVLTAEITVIDGYIDGTVRAPGQPSQVFSGWSELFGALTRLVGQADGPPETLDARAQGAS